MINVYFGGKPGLLYEIIRQNKALQYVDTANSVPSDESALSHLAGILQTWVTGDAEDTRLLAVMQSYSWVWPPETERDNMNVRSSFEETVSQIIVRGSAAGEFRASLDPMLTARSIWAIYNWGMRAAVFDGATTNECHRAIMAQVEQLILRDR